MRCIWIIFVSLLAVVSLHANEHHVIDISKTDILERTINFVIFVALMWYLVAGRLKAILKERSDGISLRLSQTQTKVREARDKKEKSQQRLKHAHDQAAEIIKIAKQEAAISVKHIEDKTKEQIASLIKANKDAMEFQEKQIQKQIVSEVLQEAFSSPKFRLETQDYVNILEKKVA